MASAAPKVVSAEVVAAQPTEGDKPMLAGLSAEVGRRLPPEAFIVKIRLEEIPEPTGSGWALYVGDTRIPKYWEYPDGIYFKVLDEAFLAEHEGERLQFSENGTEFVDTGVKLPGPGPTPAKVSRLPRQGEVLRESAPARTGRKRAAPKATRKARSRPKRRPK